MGIFQSLLNLLKKLFTKKPKDVTLMSSTIDDQDLLTSAENLVVEFNELEPPVTVPVEFSIPIEPVNTITIEDTTNDEILIDYFAEKNGFNKKMFTAVAQVESSKSGFREYNGLGLFPVLRFEPNKFNKYIKDESKFMPYTNNGKGFSSKASETNHMAYQKALKINVKATIKSTSFGKFQIMGFHYKKLGFNTPEAFLESLKTLYGQYDAFVKFIHSVPKLSEVLKKDELVFKDFETFARYYNGSSNVPVYSKKIKTAYEKL